jgi:tetratricopeptide (TPR) repeat protein
MALVELGNHDEAIEFFLQARTLAEAMGDRHALSTIHMGIAVAAFNQGQLRDALEAMEELLVIYRESGDKHRVSNCLSNIANTLYYLGEFEAAHATHQESITIDREIGKRVGLAYSLRDLGELYCHRGDYAAGLAAMEEAAAIFEEIGDDAGRAWCDLALGREYYLDIGPDSQAEALLRRALPVLQAGESHEEVADALLALGRLCLEGREHDQAQISLDQALELCQKYDLRWRLPEATARLAELALARGDAGGAADLAQQTLDAIANGGCPDLRSAAHMVLAQVADDSLHHYELAVSDARQRSRHIDLARTLAEVGHYLGDRAEVELRAQGHTYQHEAQALAEEMGLPLGRVRKAA